VGTYQDPASLPEGAVLIVGAGQTGVQLAMECAVAGREVHLATSMVDACPRSHRGKVDSLMP